MAIDSSSTLLLGGPVAAIDWTSQSFTAVGQTVFFDAANTRELTVGDYVLVSGVIAGAGSISADLVEISQQPYVAGASEIFVTGIPTAVDYGLGTIQLGELEVDYTASLAGGMLEKVGAAITVIGIQPAFDGMMLSNQVIDMTELFR